MCGSAGSIASSRQSPSGRASSWPWAGSNASRVVSRLSGWSGNSSGVCRGRAQRPGAGAPACSARTSPLSARVPGAPPGAVIERGADAPAAAPNLSDVAVLPHGGALWDPDGPGESDCPVASAGEDHVLGVDACGGKPRDPVAVNRLVRRTWTSPRRIPDGRECLDSTKAHCGGGRAAAPRLVSRMRSQESAGQV